MVVCFVHHSIDGSFNFANYLQDMIYTAKRYREKLPTSSLNVHHPEVCNESNLVLGATTVPWVHEPFYWVICRREDFPFQCWKMWIQWQNAWVFVAWVFGPHVLAVTQIYHTKGTVRLVYEVLKWSILGPLGVQSGSSILTHAIPSCIFSLNGWILYIYTICIYFGHLSNIVWSFSENLGSQTAVQKDS